MELVAIRCCCGFPAAFARMVAALGCFFLVVGGMVERDSERGRR